jgi:hypothetical protein
MGGAVFNSGFPSHGWMDRDSGVKVLPIPVLGINGARNESTHRRNCLAGVCMSITPYLDEFDIDPETKRILRMALERSLTAAAGASATMRSAISTMRPSAIAMSASASLPSVNRACRNRRSSAMAGITL